MRVLYVESADGFGGSLLSLLEVIRCLPAEIEPHLILPYDPRPFTTLPPRLSYEVVTPPHSEGRSRHRSILGGYFRYVFWWTRPLNDTVRRLRPVLIHANNLSAANLASGLVGRRHGIPVISHQRDFEFRGWPNRLIAHAGVFRHHIAISQAVGESLMALGLPARKVSVVYNAITPPAQFREPVPDDGRRPLNIAIYSMLLPWKGHEVFLRAMSLVARRVNRPLRVAVVGGEPFGSQGYLDRLKHLTTELEIDSLIEFTGTINSDNKYGHMMNTDIAVHASVDPEPFGRVIPEAMVCGAAVIATEGGGPSEIIEPDQTGLLVRRGDAESMAAAIERLVCDPALRTRLATRGREYARHAFAPETITGQVLAIYRECLRGQETFAAMASDRVPDRELGPEDQNLCSGSRT